MAEGEATVSGHDAQPTAAREQGLYERVVAHLNVGVFMASLDGRLLYVNPATLRLAGYDTSEEMLTLATSRLYRSAEDRAEFLDRLRRTGEVRGFETISVRKDGSTYPVSLSATVLRDANGAPECLLGVVEDVTEMRRARDQLEIMKYSIDHAPDPAYWLDESGRITYANEAACRALGYTHEELLELHVWDVNPRASSDRFVEVWRMLKEHGPTTIESEHRRKDGSTFPVELESMYASCAGREYCNGYARDITARRASEREREALQAKLLQSQKMESIGRLAGGVAHDFNNMLSVILGHADLALARLDPSHPLHEHLVDIRAAAKRSADLTRQLLAFARRQPARPQVLDLNQAAASMLGMLGRLIGEDIALEFRPASGLWPVKIDPSQVSQILTNLAINARDAIGGVGTLRISTRNHALDALQPEGAARALGDHVVLEVADDGRGMSPETLEHVFEPFFTTKGPGEGTGLGLSTVYGIVSQNGGFIDVESAEGAGTTFRIRLPRHLAEATSHGTDRPPPTSRGGDETILLVEDEPTVLKLTQSMLSRLGYDVLCAGSPAEALEIAREHDGAIDLLVADVVMPEMNGRELAERLSEIRPGLRRLYTSGYPADFIANRGVIDEAVNFVQKPFSEAELAAKVRGALGR